MATGGVVGFAQTERETKSNGHVAGFNEVIERLEKLSGSMASLRRREVGANETESPKGNSGLNQSAPVRVAGCLDDRLEDARRAMQVRMEAIEAKLNQIENWV